MPDQFVNSCRIFSLILIDVDWFEAITTTTAPSRRRVPESRQQIHPGTMRRPGDLAARYGHEEFAAILPDTDSQGIFCDFSWNEIPRSLTIFVIAEKLRHIVRDLNVPHNGSENKIVTVSIGVATFDASRVAMNCADLLRSADEALCGAKAAGPVTGSWMAPHLTAPLVQKRSADQIKKNPGVVVASRLGCQISRRQQPAPPMRHAVESSYAYGDSHQPVR
jgi:diguanylate cyclase (GGDEF)-like protein